MCKIIIFLLLPLQFSIAQQTEKLWRANEKLVWADFKATPKASHPFSATTATGLSYGFSANILGDEVKVNYSIKSYFIPQDSWIKKDALPDDKLLAHEQLHFDITELYVRKFRQKLSTYKFTKNVQEEIDAIYSPIAKSRVAAQQLYDAETNHSKNRVKQQEWEAKIATDLKELKQFASE